jgi:hypothetical protein
MVSVITGLVLSGRWLSSAGCRLSVVDYVLYFAVYRRPYANKYSKIHRMICIHEQINCKAWQLPATGPWQSPMLFIRIKRLA